MTKEKIIDELLRINAHTNVLRVNSDIRNSDLFAMLFQEELRYVPNRHSWYWYDGKRWVRDEGDVMVNEMCKRLASCLKEYAITYIPNGDDFDYLKIAKKWQSRNYRDTILRDARTTCALDMKAFDSNPYLINLNNGTFNLKNGELQNHNPEDYITKIAPVNYENGLIVERWDSFIDQIMSGDKEKAKFLNIAMGYALSGDTSKECMYILYGETTRNGKSTLMESIINVLGDYAATVKPETIAKTTKNSSAPNEDIARLKGIRLANISEPPKNMPLNSSLVKTLTGGDTINARYLHENSFDFKPEFKIYINTNYLPSVDDVTVFTSKRMYVIPFEHHFSEEEQDTSLKQTFQSEEMKSAILNWLIIGYYMSLAPVDVPEAVKNATKAYCNQSDDVHRFFDSVLFEVDGEKMPISDVYKMYCDWATANSGRMYSQREFGNKVNKFATVKSARIYGQVFKCIFGYKRKM